MKTRQGSPFTSVASKSEKRASGDEVKIRYGYHYWISVNSIRAYVNAFFKRHPEFWLIIDIRAYGSKADHNCALVLKKALYPNGRLIGLQVMEVPW